MLIGTELQSLIESCEVWLATATRMHSTSSFQSHSNLQETQGRHSSRHSSILDRFWRVIASKKTVRAARHNDKCPVGSQNPDCVGMSTCAITHACHPVYTRPRNRTQMAESGFLILRGCLTVALPDFTVIHASRPSSFMRTTSGHEPSWSSACKIITPSSPQPMRDQGLGEIYIYPDNHAPLE